MKKLIVLSCLTLVFYGAQAQSVTEYKPATGDLVAELGLTGGLLNTDIRLSEGALLKMRYFNSDQSAFRVGLNLTSKTEKQNFWEDNTSSNKGTHTSTEREIQLHLGYEKHFGGTDRLSPYLGADLILGLGGVTEKGDKTDGNSYRPDFQFKYSESARISTGLRAVIGADYYFVRNMYLGIEGSLGIVRSVLGKEKVSVTNNGVTNSDKMKSPGSAIEVSPGVSTGIRIGFILR